MGTQEDVRQVNAPTALSLALISVPQKRVRVPRHIKLQRHVRVPVVELVNRVRDVTLPDEAT